MPDIDLEGITPTAPDPTDLQVVRRGAEPFSVALVAAAQRNIRGGRPGDSYAGGLTINGGVPGE